eukprot:Opistho-2@97076
MCGPSRVDEPGRVETVPLAAKDARGVTKASRCVSPLLGGRSSVYALLTGNVSDSVLIGMHGTDSAAPSHGSLSSDFKSILRSRLLAASARSLIVQERTGTAPTGVSSNGAVLVGPVDPVANSVTIQAPKDEAAHGASDSRGRKAATIKDLRASIRASCAQKIQTTFWQAPIRLQDLPRGLHDGAEDRSVDAKGAVNTPPTPTSARGGFSYATPTPSLSGEPAYSASSRGVNGFGMHGDVDESSNRSPSSFELETAEAAKSLFQLGNAVRSWSPESLVSSEGATACAPQCPTFSLGRASWGSGVVVNLPPTPLSFEDQRALPVSSASYQLPHMQSSAHMYGAYHMGGRGSRETFEDNHPDFRGTATQQLRRNQFSIDHILSS